MSWDDQRWWLRSRAANEPDGFGLAAGATGVAILQDARYLGSREDAPWARVVVDCVGDVGTHGFLEFTAPLGVPAFAVLKRAWIEMRHASQIPQIAIADPTALTFANRTAVVANADPIGRDGIECQVFQGDIATAELPTILGKLPERARAASAVRMFEVLPQLDSTWAFRSDIRQSVFIINDGTGGTIMRCDASGQVVRDR